MTKLATHNSLSYIRPQWWARPFNFISKCQSMSIQEQYDFGVRYFDIRIWFKGEKVISRHGLAFYDIDVYDVLDYLNTKSETVVKLVLENWREKDCRYDDRFISFVEEVVKNYPNIKFVGGIKKIPWTRIVPKLSDVPVRDCFEKFGDDKNEIYCPKWNALHKNRYHWQIANWAHDDKYNMFDFIEIGQSDLMMNVLATN